MASLLMSTAPKRDCSTAPSWGGTFGFSMVIEEQRLATLRVMYLS